MRGLSRHCYSEDAMSEAPPRKRAPGGGRKPKPTEEKFVRRTITLPPDLDSAVVTLQEQHGEESFSTMLARLLATHTLISGTHQPETTKPKRSRKQAH